MDVSFNIITELILWCEIKHTLNMSLFNLEGYVTDNFNYSPLSDKSIQKLQEIFQFVSLKYMEVLKHVPVGWVVLYATVENSSFPLSQWLCPLRTINLRGCKYTHSD